jgi:hypothetical protein
MANPPAEKHWTQGGKIMTFIGIGLIGAGAFMMTRDNQTIASNGNTEWQIQWRVTGGITAGAGAALMILGLTRRR